MSGGGFGLGNIGSSLGKIAGSALKPVNLAGSAVGSLGGVGSVLGPALQLAGGASPLGVFGSSLAGEVLKGYTKSGGSADKPIFVDAAGKPIYAQRGYDYGANTYRVSNNPFNASNYFISGDKGVYNLLPMLGGLYGDEDYERKLGTSSYNIYNDIYGRMADDAAAQKLFSQRFGVKELNPLDFMTDRRVKDAYTRGYHATGKGGMEPPSASSMRGGKGAVNASRPRSGGYRPASKGGMDAAGYDIYGNRLFNSYDLQRRKMPTYLQHDLNQAFAELNPLEKFKATGRRDFKVPTLNPIKYVDFGFGEDATNKRQPLELLANYASQNKNPFFLAYEPVAAPAPAPAAPQPSPTGMKAGGLVALANKR